MRITLWVRRRGGGRPAGSPEKLFEEQKRERRVIPSRRVRVERMGLVHRRSFGAHRVGDNFFFPQLFFVVALCSLMATAFGRKI